MFHANTYFFLLVVHWLGMTAWVIWQNTDFCSEPWEERLYNAIVGVTEGFRKELEIVGVGYRGEVKGKEIHFALKRSVEICCNGCRKNGKKIHLQLATNYQKASSTFTVS